MKSFTLFSKKAGEGETKWEAAERQKSRCIFITGHKPLTEQEAAVLIVEEARRLLKADLERMGVQWTPQHNSNVLYVCFMIIVNHQYIETIRNVERQCM